MKKIIAFVLASGLTSVLIGMSAFAGWQRGGLEAEQYLWLAASCLLTACVHTLPALTARRSYLTKAVWAVAFAVCVFGHSQFFVFSEMHAGSARSAAQAVKVETTGMRPAAQIAQEISKATATMARLPVQKREAQEQVVQALKQELALVQSQTVQVESAEAEIKGDPVGVRVAAVLGVEVDAVMLIVSLVTAVTLEFLAVVLWSRALEKSEGQAEQEIGEPVHLALLPVDAPVQAVKQAPQAEKHDKDESFAVQMSLPLPNTSESERVRLAVKSGQLKKATVTEIRAYLRCSQKKALEVRREVAAAG